LQFIVNNLELKYSQQIRRVLDDLSRQADPGDPEDERRRE
jgi:hypothetical protein